MRKENGPQITTQRFKKVYKKGTIFLEQPASENKKEYQTEDQSQ